MLLSSIVVRPSPTQGNGLFATQPIPAGTVVWHPCPQCRVWSPEEIKLLPEDVYRSHDEYGYWLTQGRLILPCSDAFWMNHSCDPTTLDFGLNFGVAVRDIAPGDEVTLDYRTFMNDPPWTVICNCKQENCQRVISPAGGYDPLLRADWRARLVKALALSPSVPQELGNGLSEWSRSYKRLIENANPEDVLDETVSIRAPDFLETD